MRMNMASSTTKTLGNLPHPFAMASLPMEIVSLYLPFSARDRIHGGSSLADIEPHGPAVVSANILPGLREAESLNSLAHGPDVGRSNIAAR